MEGNLLSDSDRLKREVRTGARAGAVRFRTNGDMLSGPGALWLSNDLIASRMSYCPTIYWKSNYLVNCARTGLSMYPRSVYHLKPNEFSSGCRIVRGTSSTG